MKTTLHLYKVQMKYLILIFSFTITNFLNSQEVSYKITKQDTIRLPALSFKRSVALHLDEAIVLIDYNYFLNQLKEERKGLKKQIKSRERILKKGADHPRITISQLKFYQKQYPPVDSVYSALKTQKLDTFRVDHRVFLKTGSPFADFLPSLIEAKKCMILDLDYRLQRIIIQQRGNQKTGQMTGVGSSFYFIPGAKRHFWSKMDWVS